MSATLGVFPFRMDSPGRTACAVTAAASNLGMSERHRAGDGVERGDTHHRVGDHLQR
jgi:hypothetical protein